MAQRRINIVTAVNAANVSKSGNVYTVRDVVHAVDGIVLNRRMYPGNELKKAVKGLNGKPAPAGHPKDSKGRHISATNGEALAAAWIGAYCQNSRYEGGRAMVDIVINGDQAKALDAGRRVIERLDAAIAGTNAEPIGVSSGLFLEEVAANGKSLGKEYSAIATNMAFDHIAILLDETPAGTPEEGVGMFLNSAGQEEEIEVGVLNAEDADVAKAEKSLKAAIALHEKHMNGTAPTTGADGEKSQMKMMRMMKAALEYLTGKGAEEGGNSKDKPKAKAKGMGGMKMNDDDEPSDRRSDSFMGWLHKLLGNTSELSFDQISSGLYALLPSGAWLQEVFDRYAIWRDAEGRLWRQDYSVSSENASVAWSSNPVEVARRVEYEPITNVQKDDKVKTSIIAALNAAGISGVAAMTDDELLAAYNALQAKPHIAALNAEQVAHGVTKSKLSEVEVAANAARDAELTQLATELATNSSLTADDFKAMGLARCKELKAKAAPVVVGTNAAGKQVDEFDYDINALGKEA